MSKWIVYWKLMRFHKPVGSLLLWYPTAWALWSANHGMPSLKLFLLFFSGTIIMRAAGCVINDIADRDIDNQVQRTQLRPLTHGDVGLIQALVLVFILLSCAFLVLIQLPLLCVYWGILALLITIVYPLCKRFFRAPQFVLGFAFSMSIPMVYLATLERLNPACFLLMLINFLWIVAYDTMYALVDEPDDRRIGIQSTAIFFGKNKKFIIDLLQFVMHLLWLYFGAYLHCNYFFYGCWSVASLLLMYQHRLIRKLDLQYCLEAFNISAHYGGIMWLGLILGLSKLASC